MKRRTASLAALLALGCSPLFGLAAGCGGDDGSAEGPDASTGGGGDAAPPPDTGLDSTTQGADSGRDAGATATPDTGSTADGPVSSHDAGADANAADATYATDAADAGSEDAHDGGDAGPSCAPVTATPVVVSGTISASTTWTCDNVYLVKGVVQVSNPGVDYGSGGTDAGSAPTTVLTIEPGTTVLMSNDPNDNGSLLILPGAQLHAVGTSDAPIVFTSQALNTGATGAPGDWGAVVLAGWAPGNYGANGPDGGAQMQGPASSANDWTAATGDTSGTNGDTPLPFQAGSYDSSHDTDSSGTLKYVRMEYGGSVKVNLTPDAGTPLRSVVYHEMLGLYGAGSGTTLSYLDLRQAIWGCVFAEGGQFLADHIVCQYHGQSGGFDVSRGNQSKAQFILVQESPNFTSEGIGYKGPNGNGTGGVEEPALLPLTAPTIYNATTCGSFGGTAFEDPFAFFMKRAPGGYLANFIGTGYYGGVLMQNDFTDGGVKVPAPVQMVSSILWNNFDPSDPDAGTSNVSDPNPSVPQPDYADLSGWFGGQANNSTTTNPNINAGCQNPNKLQMGPPVALTAGAATPPNDGFFDSNAKYIGAFKDSTDTWASGKWVVWSAQ